MISKEYIETAPNLAERFLEDYRGGVNIVLYGGGWAAHWYLRWLFRNAIIPKYIVDNDPDKRGTLLEEIIEGSYVKIPVLSKEDLKNVAGFADFSYLVGAPKYKKEIIQEIEQTFGKVKIYSFESEIYYTFIKDIPAYRSYLMSQMKELSELSDMLEDKKSKDTLDKIIMGRITANQDYFIDIMEDNQYFPKDIVKLSENDVLVEIGSNDGRSLLDMVHKTNGHFQRIYCFEPDVECIKLLKNIISGLNMPITLIPKGCGIGKSKLFFKADPVLGASRVVENEAECDYSVEITTIDDEIKEKVTYIKMDVEGMELDCLKGAEETIRRYAPKLAVCVYHNPQDLITIPRYLSSVNPNYKFYLRHHNWGATETVLYAV